MPPPLGADCQIPCSNDLQSVLLPWPFMPSTLNMHGEMERLLLRLKGVTDLVPSMQSFVSTTCELAQNLIMSPATGLPSIALKVIWNMLHVGM